jgi:hypothetical protein
LALPQAFWSLPSAWSACPSCFQPVEHQVTAKIATRAPPPANIDAASAANAPANSETVNNESDGNQN